MIASMISWPQWLVHNVTAAPGSSLGSVGWENGDVPGSCNLFYAQDNPSRDTTATGPNGAIGTREVVVACDKAAGRCTKDVEVNSNN